MSALSFGHGAADPITIWHRAGEQAIRDTGLGWTFLRPTALMSNALIWVPTVATHCVVHAPFGWPDREVVDLDAPRAQRDTATRIIARLVDEHGMTGISHPVVRAYASRRKPEIRIEHDHGEPGGFVPQTHLLGREAEVDFVESRSDRAVK